ncbi:toxin-antitoxin system YwqK family antitoxin [Leptotrichia buccalis]
MLELFKQSRKSIIILFSCISTGIFSSAATVNKTKNIPAKRSSEYTSQSSRALSSYYSTVANVTISGNYATLKDTGQPFTGTYVEFNKIGRAQAVRNYQNGALNGTMFSYYDNGNISKVANYINGIREGEDIDFYGNGNSRTIRNYKNDMLNGDGYDFDEFGRLTSSVQYVNNARNGKELKLSNGIVTNENTYVNGQLNGKTKFYYSNGTVRVDGNYTRNLRDGKWTWNYENGTKKLIENYKNGTITDIIGYSRTGVKEREMKLDNGSGTFTQFYDNGKIKTQGTLRHYQPYGTWTFYSQEGYITDTQGFY